jgi:membrane protease YdiL (CAAX protease family)
MVKMLEMITGPIDHQPPFMQFEPLSSGRYWIFHGLCWSLFHIPFGWQLFLTILPILFIQSLAVQKTKNTWIGVLIHAVINGPSFIAISLGFL